MIRFVNVNYWPDVPERGVAYLKNDNWDDYRFKTTFELMFVDRYGEKHELGALKIITAGMTHGRTKIPAMFFSLEAQFCSLGQGQDYYERLYEISEEERNEIVRGLRDCVADPMIWSSFQNEKATTESLLRSVDEFSVTNTFRNILNGVAAPTSYHFRFTASPSPGREIEIDFSVSPKSLPPTNIHVLIGRNGVGKTRLLAGLALAITSPNATISSAMAGQVDLVSDMFFRGPYRSGKFANLVTVAFSAFDRFPAIPNEKIIGDMRYSYVGLRKPSVDTTSPGDLKSHAELNAEFAASLSQSLNGPRHARWVKVTTTLNSDPGFAELGLHELSASNHEELGRAVARFDQLSSGHRLVLLTAANLVQLVDERTLVLIDEPESHLHPPLLSSLMRALSSLLTMRNGVAIVATHSPVVLQEVPKECVTILRRTGDLLTTERPQIQTFAENVGVLTREVFQLEVTSSGYHTLLHSAAATRDYGSALALFDGKLGSEGRAILRAMTSARA